MYTPKPIDTTKIKLPEELLALTEKIAENGVKVEEERHGKIIKTRQKTAENEYDLGFPCCIQKRLFTVQENLSEKDLRISGCRKTIFVHI